MSGSSRPESVTASLRIRQSEANRHPRELGCSPASLGRPHPFVLVGGGGERKTLRLVAQYANACNVFSGGDEARHKLDVLRSHCETAGRDYDEIEKTTTINIDAFTSQGELLDKLSAGHDLGFTTTYVFAATPSRWPLSSCSPGSLARSAAGSARSSPGGPPGCRKAAG